METKDWLVFLASFGALFFSVLNFRRTRSLENQNHIFRLKIDAYIKIITDLNELVNQLQSSLNSMHLFIKNPNDKDAEMLLQKSLDYDDACLKFDDLLIQHSLLFPKNVMFHLEELSQRLLETELPEVESLSVNQNEAEVLEGHLDHLIVVANNLVAVLRKDMHSDRLNTDLFKRIENKLSFR